LVYIRTCPLRKYRGLKEKDREIYKFKQNIYLETDGKFPGATSMSIINLPDGKKMVVDSKNKSFLTDYERYVNADERALEYKIL